MNRWMKIAYDEAKEGMQTNSGGPFGAVIVKDGKIIAKAHNSVLLTKDPTAHAEVNVIRLASQKEGKFNLKGYTLYTTCMPCPMCLGAIMWSRIDTVYYGSDEMDAKKAGFDDLKFYEMLEEKHKGLSLKQINQEQSTHLFELWSKKEDKILY